MAYTKSYPQLFPQSDAITGDELVALSGPDLGDILKTKTVDELAAYIGGGTFTNVVGSLAALRAIEPVARSVMVLGRTVEGDGYQGPFEWIEGDQSANVANDPSSGVWVARNGDPTGSGGAYKRVYDGALNVLWFGADPTGSQDSAPGISASIKYSQKTMEQVYVPGGTYLHVTTMQIVPTASIDVAMSREAILKASPLLAGKMWWFNAHTDTTEYRVRINGGYFDGSELPGRIGFSDDLLSFNGYLRDILVEDAVFWFGPLYTGVSNVGSSCIFASARGITVANCALYGSPDTAIYTSRDPIRLDTDGVIITNNRFIGCHSAANNKRVGRFFQFEDNYVELCETGVFTGEADSGPTLLPGKHMVVVGNTFNRVTNPVSVRVSSGDVVSANHVIDFGYAVDGVTQQTNAAAVSVQGSNDVVVTGNAIEMVDLVPFATQRAVWIRTVTYNGVNYDSVRTLVSNNISRNVWTFVEEQNANCDFNRVIDNIVTGQTNTFVQSGANSAIHRLNLAQNAYEINEASVSLAGLRGQEAFRAQRVPNAVNWWEASGAAAGNVVTITATGADANVVGVIATKGSGALLLGGASGAEVMRLVKAASMVNAAQVIGSASGAPIDYSARGSDADIDVRLLPKGAGLPRFGAFSSNADAPVTGYITIKDSAGNTRKLATIA